MVNQTQVIVPPEIVGWWQDLADDRDVRGTLTILPFTDKTAFGEVIGNYKAVTYAAQDDRITPLIFLRSNGAHEIRHLEHNQRPWLVDWYVRESIVNSLLKAEGLLKPTLDFLDRHHDELPEEVDAYTFEKEVAGFDARPFAAAVRKAMKGEGDWPNPQKYVVRTTRPIRRQG